MRFLTGITHATPKSLTDSKPPADLELGFCFMTGGLRAADQ
jgi:hypothetical protein